MPTNHADAFTAFVREHQRSLKRTALLIAGTDHDADDLLQSAWARLYPDWPRLSRRPDLIACVKRTLVTIAIDRARLRRNSELIVSHFPDSIGPDFASAVADRDFVMRALDRLPIQQRAAVVLRHYEDFSLAQIATMLHCSTSSAQVHLRRGEQRMQELLGVTVAAGDLVDARATAGSARAALTTA